MKAILHTLILMMLVPQLWGKDFQVTHYGALGDGLTLNTKAIQKAINACAESGGGRVVFTPGTFLSGTLVMKSHVELHLEKGATLLGSTNAAHYPEMTTTLRFYGDQWVKQSLIFGAELEDIALSGDGVIDGQGAAFQVNTKKKPDRYRNRPYLIRFTACTGVKVSDLTMRNSAMWMQHYLGCEDVIITGITVFNHCNKNNDMIDIDGCKNVVIKDCIGDTDDDALTLKSTSPLACENVTVSNCILSSHCNAIKMGTESTGGFKNITITNCVIQPSAVKEVIYGLPGGISGISLELVDGGVMEEIVVNDVEMDGPEVPLFIRLGNRARPHREGIPAPGVGSMSKVLIRNIVARNAGNTGCSISGIPDHAAKEISISNLKLQFKGGVEPGMISDPVPELVANYPEASMFGTLPSSVFYLRHLQNINISGVEVEFEKPDGREHLVVEDVDGFTHSGITLVSGEELGIRVNPKR